MSESAQNRNQNLSNSSGSKNEKQVMPSDVLPFSSRRQFLWRGGATLAALGLFQQPLLGQCPTSPVGPMNCAPPSGSNQTIDWTPDPNLPMRTRWSAFDPAGAANLQKLNQAYAALRKLTSTNPDDPRGWMQQANVHCWYCGGGQDEMQGPEIHGCWWFFPWHRCYLYFHERILGTLINDPTLTLPYWNWDDISSNPNLGVPGAYFQGALNDSNREATTSDRIQSAYVDVSGLLENDEEDWFGTDPGNSEPSNGGVLENGPHGIVHLWVGAAHEPNLCSVPPVYGKPDMGVLTTAAQDPVFFAHHCNIDRLWDVWLDYQAGRDNPPWPPDHSWTFYNANFDGTGQWVTMNVSDVINHEQSLKYQYASPTGVVLTANVSSQEFGLGQAPVTKTIQIPQPIRSRLAGTAKRAAPRGGSHILHIELEMSANQGAFVHVFGNLPTATAQTSVNHPNFLGYFAIVPKGHKDHIMTRHVIVDVTRKLPAIAAGRRSLSLTLVPKGGPVLTGVPPQIKVKRMYLTSK
jgi:polyphenol oxidase